MAVPTFYTLRQASEITGLQESQLEDFIKRGKLTGTYNHNILSYIVLHDDLTSFMKAQGLQSLVVADRKKHVIICDRDQKIPMLLRGELERGGKVVVRQATSSKDAELQIAQEPPDAVVIHLAALQRAADGLGGVIRKARETTMLRLVVFHNDPDAVVKANPDVQRLMEHLKVDACISVAGGTRTLLYQLNEMLGLKTTMRMIRPLGTNPGLPQPPPPGR